MDFTYSRQKIVEKNIYGLQWQRFEAFKLQDTENEHFNVSFLIHEKILHADKFTLVAVSETLNAMLSSRWTKKDEPIKIESYTYDNFYQFLCFLYSGDCEITEENVFQLTDMAEFYGVKLLKEFCEKFLLSINLNNENIEEMFEVAQKYSLDELLSTIKVFIDSDFFIQNKELKNFKQSFIEFLISVNYGHRKEEVFLCVYEWAKYQVLKQKTNENENFNLQKAVKKQLYAVLPDPKFTEMTPSFLFDFVVGKGFILSSKELFQCFMYHQKDSESTFEYIYRLAEMQAMLKQNMSYDSDNFNVARTMKAYLAELLPHVEFYKFSKVFLFNFVFQHGFFLFPDDFSKYLLHARRNFFSPKYDEKSVLKDMYELAEKQAHFKKDFFWWGKSFCLLFHQIRFI